MIGVTDLLSDRIYLVRRADGQTIQLTPTLDQVQAIDRHAQHLAAVDAERQIDYGPIDAATFKNIAKAQIPTVVNIRTEARARTRQAHLDYLARHAHMVVLGGVSLVVPTGRAVPAAFAGQVHAAGLPKAGVHCSTSLWSR